jgi:hypothetical protein
MEDDMVVLVTVTRVNRISATQIQAELLYEWGTGRTATDTITADVNTATPAQAISAIRDQAIAFVAQPAAGGFVVAAKNVWIIGGPQ